ncbi:LytR/AlgR family response regulator transcription factor [Abyssalbus ytuae]|uniref:LytTR family DNA-binding domain-containing protein n=1 Tax=Abyssalbus ytuae TaxID=2926907 RepID=A0A9E7A0P0_9FLAO|nr:LytTR family DNA-binding domain-containing protein [Abyssalbus ytuae]UOB18772.1 LytTR family DNA-binding domain-containing protein [Abyssalbus ytuae]
MRCIIIDDEPLAINVLKNYCEKLDFLEMMGAYNNPINAISDIKEKKIDLILIDIEMPQMNGLDFMNSLDNKPLFIFTTAYPQYAVDGFDLNAVDYLVKPIPYHRFIKAISRAKELYELSKSKNMMNVFPSVGVDDKQYIFVKAEYENVKIDINKIKYVQGLKDYLKIHIEGTNKPILTLMNFRGMMEKLPDYFIRIHKSFVININQIKSVQKNRVIIDDVRIPIGESYKSEFNERLGL